MNQVDVNRMAEALPCTMPLVRNSLHAVEDRLASQLTSDVPIIDEMVRCGATLGGKRFRPILLLLSAQANGGVDDRHIQLATAIEMIHAATLVHDDIIDGADTRRHVSTINNRWGNQGAVLFGDYLFTQAFYLASLTGSADACRIIGEATNRVCEGELQQTDAAGNFETSLEEYYEIISRKTAALCACATHLGAIFSASPAHEGDGKSLSWEHPSGRWYDVGANLGMAFQIIDDILDYQGDVAAVGKTLGTDLKTAKPTLPVLLALQSSTESERAVWMERLMSRTTTVEEVTEWLEKTGSLVQARQMATGMVQDALGITSQFEDVADAFEELGKFLLMRSM